MNVGATLTCHMELPDDFCVDDVLAFHKRDPLMVAERVDAGMLQKGLTWEGNAACLTIEFRPRHAYARLAVDAAAMDGEAGAFDRMVRRMLGLTQRIEDFEAAFRAHPQLGALIVRHPGLRVPLAATPFEALTWAVTGQQISVGAATALRRKLIAAANVIHSSGLCCHPDAERIIRMDEADLRQAGYSQAKARTLIALSRGVHENCLPLDAWTKTVPVDDMRERLLDVPGIGPWTVNYTLLRGFGWLDGSLHGDAAVRRGLQKLLGSMERVTEDTAKGWLAEFSPWRALVAAHLWAMQMRAAE